LSNLSLVKQETNEKQLSAEKEKKRLQFFTRPIEMRLTTSTSVRRCFASIRSAIPSPRRPRFSNRVQRVATITLRRLEASKATTTRPLDATEELFDALSGVAAVEESNDERPAVAFTCSTSTSTSSSSPSSTARGRGLFATRDLAKGAVALRVPGSLCLVVDYSRDGGRGLSLPTGGGGADGGKDGASSTAQDAGSGLQERRNALGLVVGAGAAGRRVGGRRRRVVGTLCRRDAAAAEPRRRV